MVSAAGGCLISHRSLITPKYYFGTNLKKDNGKTHL